MNRCKTFLLALALFASGAFLTAQVYDSAIGLRLGYPLSVSYKSFISTTDAIEVYAGFRGYRRYNWVSINGAYQRHERISEVNGLEWYYGGGVGLQFWNYDFDERGSTTLSLAGYLGLQYTFPDSPISLSLDWIPRIFVGTIRTRFEKFGGGYGGLGVRYVLGR
jgi:hypothetical protein